MRGLRYQQVYQGLNMPFWIRKRNIVQNQVGANAQPCLTPLLMENPSDMSGSYCTFPCMFSWNTFMRNRSVGAHPAFSRTRNRACLSTRSKIVVRSMKAIWRGWCCSQDFVGAVWHKISYQQWNSLLGNHMWFGIYLFGNTRQERLRWVITLPVALSNEMPQ